MIATRTSSKRKNEYISETLAYCLIPLIAENYTIVNNGSTYGNGTGSVFFNETLYNKLLSPKYISLFISLSHLTTTTGKLTQIELCWQMCTRFYVEKPISFSLLSLQVYQRACITNKKKVK